LTAVILLVFRPWASNPSLQANGPSLFCFALMLSDSYEVALLSQQFDKGVSLFGCNGYSVFSDAALQLGRLRPLVSEIIPGPLRVDTDPRYNFALNTRVFLRVWDRVFTEGKFRDYDWTVKVDPDTVFLPSRLREHLSWNPPPGDGVMYVNCPRDFGFHGPLEVLSRQAVELFRAGTGRCRRERAAGLDKEGEDMFLAACLELLHVDRVKDFGLLSDEACMEHPFPCYSGKVAFHPLKRADKYFECLAQAEQ